MSVEIIEVAAYLGAGISVGLASISAGIGEGYAAGYATSSLMKQPKAADSLLKSMLVGQAVTETGAIFSLVVSLLLIFGGLVTPAGGLFKAAALLAAGIAIGVGSIGPGFGSGYIGGQACKSIGRMPRENTSITASMLIGQALSQTSSIFALVVSLLLLYSTPDQPADATMGQIIIKVCAYLGAGLAIGLGTIGPGTGIGLVGGNANDMMGRYPKQRALITRTMFLGAAVSESTAIYALVVSFLLMFVI